MSDWTNQKEKRPYKDLVVEIDRLRDYLQDYKDLYCAEQGVVGKREREIERLTAECGLWQKYAEHLLGCTCSDHMDCGRVFYRSDWPCSCGLRELQNPTSGSHDE